MTCETREGCKGEVMYTLTLIPINDLVCYNLNFDPFTCRDGLFIFLLSLDWNAIKSIEAVIVNHNIDLSYLII